MRSLQIENQSRRQFLMTSAMGACLPVFLGAGRSFLHAETLTSDPWAQLPKILARIKPPIFPSRDFEISKYGAIGDGGFDNSAAFQKAIAVCSEAGGGTVLVPKGDFLTGAIHLKSNVRLHLSEGATIRFLRDPNKYPIVLTRFEGVEVMNFSPFIYAFEQENIAITGTGTLDGNADEEHWWSWKGRKSGSGPTQNDDRNRLFAMSEQRVPVKDRIFGPGHYLRPNFVQPYRCKNVLIEGITLLHSPMWQLHPALCTNVTVRGVTMNSAGPNNDGCDPESCADVLMDNCFFNTGDDCIAIKSGRNEDGRRVNVPSENIIIRNCRMQDGHGGVGIGSEISGGVRNVFAENCRMDSPNLSSAVRIKNNAMRGGDIEHIYARNITVGQVAMAGVSIDFNYEEGDKGKFTPVVRDVQIENLTTHEAKYAVYLRGFDSAPIEGVSLKGCDFEGVQDANVIEHVKDIAFRDVKINGKTVSSPA